ncbi:peptidoglycan DD-metalloendopeptidase family protein [Pseudohongiella spirulinae]|uniref:Peptidase M23 n=1 Tax=Pseudohongiella spirulinae TaxID=1249552 RepID=A0A0S2KCM5_9GAMM|nr:peptidoglycan DD-metalloendopeptidase family protein [Pseudohongiella spirulinae]ALO46064.1 peptidase M23 [Pseudohongiella spirulinae]
MKKMPLLFMSFLLVLGCASSYEAPIDDRSDQLVRERAVIIESGQSIESTARRTPASVTSSSGAGQDTVGSSETVVRAVTVGGGIRRVTERVVSETGSSAQDSTLAAQTHVVVRGDTLYSIAWNYDLDVRTLALINQLNPPYTIFPGQRLRVSADDVASSTLSQMPSIPASPAGEENISRAGNRPQSAIDARRTGSVNTRQVDGVTWQWPADGRLLATFTANGASRGLDIAGMRGDPVYAAADGDVVYAGQGIQGAGNLIILRHSARFLSAYMHNSLMLVQEGDRIRAGDKIAEFGTGPTGRDMLHFEVRVDGKPADPVQFLPAR